MIREWLEKRASEADAENAARADRMNSKPCEACSNKDFVQLYRNVVGEIEGHMSGYWSLFGGSMSGYISGYTKTLPVLSCTKCHNERLIQTWKYTYSRDLFWSDMYNLYAGTHSDSFGYDPTRLKGIHPNYLENPAETRQAMFDLKDYDHDYMLRMADWGTSQWAAAGFKVDKVPRKFLWFKWQGWPSWYELGNKQKGVV